MSGDSAEARIRSISAAADPVTRDSPTALTRRKAVCSQKRHGTSRMELDIGNIVSNRSPAEQENSYSGIRASFCWDDPKITLHVLRLRDAAKIATGQV
jgi:hypothetical protein